MQAVCLSVIAAVALGQGSAGERVVQPPREKHMPHCLISLIEEAQVPAEERGVLMNMTVKDPAGDWELHQGASVHRGQVMAQIDDREAKLAKEVAEFALREAEERANNEVDIKFYEASAEASEADYLEVLDANRKEKGTYTDSDVRRYRLQWKKSVAQVDQGKWNKILEGLARDVKAAELRAAEMALAKRKIDAPMDGVVVELYKHVGEWVEPGQPVMRVVRMDRLRVEGFLRSAELSPGEVLGRPVTIRVQLPHGNVDIKSQITFVSPIVEGSGEYRVWADIKNRIERDKTNEFDKGHWLISPGMLAEMTIALRK